MTIYSGQIQVTRYKILGPGAARRLTQDRLNEAGKKWQAVPLVQLLRADYHPADSQAAELSTGWVAPEGVMATKEWISGIEQGATVGSKSASEAPWDLSLGTVRDGVMLRMRIDHRRVPAQLVRELYKQKLLAEQATGNGKRKRLSRDERDALKQHVRQQLTGRALPTFKFVDAFWRDEAAELQVFTTSEPALKAFEELFAKSFGASLDISLARMSLPMQAAPDGFWVDGKGSNDAIDRWLMDLASIVPASVGVAGLSSQAGT